jgi:hypothetical protein
LALADTLGVCPAFGEPTSFLGMARPPNLHYHRARMNFPAILRNTLLTGTVLLAAWGVGHLWPEHAYYIRHFFRELLRALL